MNPSRCPYCESEIGHCPECVYALQPVKVDERSESPAARSGEHETGPDGYCVRCGSGSMNEPCESKPAESGAREPRVYWAVWEDYEEGEDGWRSGAISSESGGNLYWEDNQFPVVEKSAYDKLQADRDELKAFYDRCNATYESIETLTRERDAAHVLVDEMANMVLAHDKRASENLQEANALRKERDRMKKALERIAALEFPIMSGPTWREIARAALGEEGEK